MANVDPTVLAALAENPREATWGSLPELWAAYASERKAGRSPFCAAVDVATGADRLGHAFAVGYPAALEHLIRGIELPCALCVTEAGGNRPRAIETTLSSENARRRIDGAKTFVTLGTLAKTLIVVARAGETPDGRPELAVVRIPADREGVALRELPPTPFVPEIVHASVTFSGVEVLDQERLPGDGYLRYVKPFRTIEDIHVVGATLGYVLGWARRAEQAGGLLPIISANLVALERLLAFDPLDPRAHVALEGVYRQITTLFAGEAFDSLCAAADDVERERWSRDRALLSVAQKARSARFMRALEDLR